MRRGAVTLLTIAVISVAVAQSARAQLAVTKLQPDGSPASADFNSQKGKSRLLIVLSPT